MKFWEEWNSKRLGAVVVSRCKAWWHSLDRPVPWSAELDAAVRSADAIPVCHRCTTPYELPVWFCPVCGAAVGPYNNLMPYVRIFSIGEALRSGVGPEAHFNRFRVLAYASIGLIEYGMFSPFYFIRLYLNFRKQHVQSRHPGNALGEVPQDLLGGEGEDEHFGNT